MDEVGVANGQPWERFATEESKNAIMFWLIGGLVYNAVTGHLVSLSTVLLILPGIFIASLAAIPTALINRIKIRRVTAMRDSYQRGLGAFAKLTLWTLWSLLVWVWQVLVAILAMTLLHSLGLG